ncbi:MAG: hypothetical protein NWR54_06865, partial [Paracoccaceae bacterium]|nr:hypothetical protein [Paracoccaceae bacterium]
MQTVSLSFFRFTSVTDRLWALAMMGVARLWMPRVPGIGFWKLCGSGTGEGFTPVPNTGVYAILATWPDEATARQQTAHASIYQRYRRRSVEDWTVFLAPTSARGVWSGIAPFTVTEPPCPGPLAAAPCHPPPVSLPLPPLAKLAQQPHRLAAAAWLRALTHTCT